MISKTNPQFWKCFRQLPDTVKVQAFNAYRKWRRNSYERGLHFKQVGQASPIYSVRIGLDWRAMGIKKDNKIIWFWIGSHADYNHLYRHF